MLDRLATIEERYDEIEHLMADPELAVDYTRVQELAKELASMRAVVKLSREYRAAIKDMADLLDISRDDSDQDLALLAREELAELASRQEDLEEELRLALLPSDPNDSKNVIMELRAGVGGDEAGLFVSDLFRMYTRYAQRMGWPLEVIDASHTGLGVIKEVVYQIRGEGAYSRLKHESGGHRVQRVPTTESSGRIHTSAATVAVLPEAEEVDVAISAEDIQIDVYHASGHGGQNVQKVATAIRITHKPTGIVAVCQDERSQFKNKEKAMAVLRSRLLAREIERQQREVGDARRSQIGTGDRSDRVRTYNFPQNRVTDHRTSLTTHSLEAVLDGDIDQLIDASIHREQQLLLQAAAI